MADQPRNDAVLWGYDEVAEYLGNSPETVRRWATDRRLPVVKVGKLNRFRPEDIKAWAAEQVQPVAPKDPPKEDDPFAEVRAEEQAKRRHG